MVVASCGQTPPSGDRCTQAKLAEEGHELKATSVYSAKSNSEAELSFLSLYSPDAGTPVC